ncbi:hypothetical protein BaRGS_00033854 [Batillaria attramentaria]|uniref:Uncharacterized protein n=1 Tax=Batillaria attramentaria TaxID=370345 RepID=A0ABD0JJ66_9CAEN
MAYGFTVRLALLLALCLGTVTEAQTDDSGNIIDPDETPQPTQEIKFRKVKCFHDKHCVVEISGDVNNQQIERKNISEGSDLCNHTHEKPTCCQDHRSVKVLRKLEGKNTDRFQKFCQILCEEGNCSHMRCDLPKLLPNFCKGTNKNQGETTENNNNVITIVLGSVVAALIVVVIILFLLWWKGCRLSSDDNRGVKRNPSTVAMREAETMLTDVEPGTSGAGEIETMPGNRMSEHIYCVIPDHLVVPTKPSQERKVGYAAASNVTERKLPPLPAQDGDYSLAKIPEDDIKENAPQSEPPEPNVGVVVVKIQNQQPITDALGKERSAEGHEKDERGVILLEENKADTERGQSPSSRKLRSLPTPVCINSLGQNTAEEIKETPPQSSASQPSIYSVATTEKTQTPIYPGTQGRKAERYTEEHFTPDKKATSTDKDQANDGQYFILEEDAAKDNAGQQKVGQYFILEEEAAATSDKGQGQVGQYFILEEEASGFSSSAAAVSEHSLDTEYSTLDRADMVTRERTDQDAVYTALVYSTQL